MRRGAAMNRSKLKLETLALDLDKVGDASDCWTYKLRSLFLNSLTLVDFFSGSC